MEHCGDNLNAYMTCERVPADLEEAPAVERSRYQFLVLVDRQASQGFYPSGLGELAPNLSGILREALLRLLAGLQCNVCDKYAFKLPPGRMRGASQNGLIKSMAMLPLKALPPDLTQDMNVEITFLL